MSMPRPLTPEVRVNKNGVPVIKHVALDPKASIAHKTSLPSPAATVRQTLPPLKGKDRKEASWLMEEASGSGVDAYADRITAHYLDNDLEKMRFIKEICLEDDDISSYAEDTLLILDCLERLELDKGEYLKQRLEAHRTSISLQLTEWDDYRPRNATDDGDDLIRLVDRYPTMVREIDDLYEKRGENMEVTEFITLWEDSQNNHQALREGTL